MTTNYPTQVLQVMPTNPPQWGRYLLVAIIAAIITILLMRSCTGHQPQLAALSNTDSLQAIISQQGAEIEQQAGVINDAATIIEAKDKRIATGEAAMNGYKEQADGLLAEINSKPEPPTHKEVNDYAGATQNQAKECEGIIAGYKGKVAGYVTQVAGYRKQQEAFKKQLAACGTVNQAIAAAAPPKPRNTGYIGFDVIGNQNQLTAVMVDFGWQWKRTRNIYIAGIGIGGGQLVYKAGLLIPIKL